MHPNNPILVYQKESSNIILPRATNSCLKRPVNFSAVSRVGCVSDALHDFSDTLRNFSDILREFADAVRISFRLRFVETCSDQTNVSSNPFYNHSITDEEKTESRFEFKDRSKLDDLCESSKVVGTLFLVFTQNVWTFALVALWANKNLYTRHLKQNDWKAV